MEAQQIRLHINELVKGIEDEAFLKACHEAVEGIAKAYRRVAGKSNGAKSPAKTAFQTGAGAEKPLPHDLPGIQQSLAENERSPLAATPEGFFL